jgi:hypothetical protein
MPAPTWKFDLLDATMRQLASHAFLAPQQHVHAVAEETDAPAVVLGGATGRLYRLDLVTGEARELVKLPGDMTIIRELAMSADGKTVGVATHTIPPSDFANRQGMGNQHWTWQIWDYPRLRRSTV